MSATTVDSKHRVILDKRVRETSGIKKGHRLTVIPFHRGVILMAPEAKSFAESLKGFKYREADHEASRHILRQTRHARS